MVLQRGCPNGQPRSPGDQPKDLKVCAMISRIERQIDRIVPAFLVSLSLFAAVSTAVIGI